MSVKVLSWMLFLLVFPLMAWAGGESSAVTVNDTAKASASSWTAELPFATTIGSKAPLRMQGHGASVRVPFSVPFDERVEQLNVVVRGRVSQGMIGTALLEAQVGNNVIGQFTIKPGSHIVAHFDIPVSHLSSGFHTLVLQLIGVPGDSGSNWVQINARKSLFRYATTQKSLNPQLDHLGWLFDRASLDYHPIIALFTVSHSLWSIDAASYVAEGVGLRYQFLPATIDVHPLVTQSTQHNPENLSDVFSTLPQQCRIAVLIGTANALQPILSEMELPKVHHATIAVQRFPGHADHAILLITGANAEQVVLAARTFADTNFAYPPSRYLQIRGSTENSQNGGGATPVLTSPFQSAVYPLSITGFKTATINGFNGPINLRVWNGGWQRSAELRLNLVYSAGMAATSDVDVLFNGALVGSIPLDAPGGGKYIKYAVSIPSSETRTGWNTLTLVPNLIPAVSHNFLYNAERANLQLSLYDNSTLSWQGGNTLQQFDFTALSSSGFLGTKPGKAVNLVVPDSKNPQILSAVATLLGKVAQRQGTAFPIHAATPENLDDGPILAISPLNALPDTFQQRLGLSEVQGGLWEFSRPLEDAVGTKIPPSGHYVFAPGNHGYALSTQYNGYPLLAFTAPNGAILASAIKQVISFGMWPQLQGFTDWWRMDGKTVHNIGVAQAPFYALGTVGGVGVWASQHLWAFLLALFAVAIAISVSIFTFVRRRYHRLQQEGSARPVLSASGEKDVN